MKSLITILTPLLFIMLNFMPNETRCQRVKTNNDIIRSYEKGPLTWNDFTIREFQTRSNFYWFITSNDITTKYKNEKIRYNSCTANMNKNLSVVSRSEMTDTLLQHFQNIFDIAYCYTKDVEYYQRYEAKSTLFGDQNISNIYEAMQSEISIYLEDSKNGTKHDIVYSYKDIIEDKIKNSASVGNILNYTEGDHSIFVNFYIGHNSMIGKVNEYIPNQVGGGIGLGYEYKKIRAEFTVNLLARDIKKDFTIGGNNYNKNQNFDGAVPTGNLGYRMNIRKDLEMIPSLRIGGFSSSLIPKNVDNPKALFTDSQFLYGVGLDINYLLFRRVKLTKNYLDPRSVEYFGLGIMLTYNRISTKEVIKGDILGLALKFNLGGTFLK